MDSDQFRNGTFPAVVFLISNCQTSYSLVRFSLTWNCVEKWKTWETTPLVLHTFLTKAISIVTATLQTAKTPFTKIRNTVEIQIVKRVQRKTEPWLDVLAGPWEQAALCSKPWLWLSPGSRLGLSRLAGAKLADTCLHLNFPATTWTYRRRVRKWTKLFRRFAMTTQQFFTATMGLTLLKHVVL